MNYIWGEVNHREKIVESLTQHYSKLGLKISNHSFEHIKSGFADNVFLVKTNFSDQEKTQTLVVKEYLKDWHQKEIAIYGDLLQTNKFLGAPKLLDQGQNFIVLEYLSPQETEGFTTDHTGLLKKWIVKKHNFFSGKKTIGNFSENREIQKHYLIEKPLLTIEKVLIKLRVVGIIKSNEDKFHQILTMNNELPQTLEHGDLEPQNLFIQNGGFLRVVDWVNARQGSGLFDINQYFETANEVGAKINYQTEIKEIAKEIKFDELEQVLPRVRQLMLLNKINFYGEKYLLGEEKSYSKSKPIRSLFESFLNELLDNIERNN